MSHPAAASAGYTDGGAFLFSLRLTIAVFLRAVWPGSEL